MTNRVGTSSKPAVWVSASNRITTALSPEATKTTSSMIVVTHRKAHRKEVRKVLLPSDPAAETSHRCTTKLHSVECVQQKKFSWDPQGAKGRKQWSEEARKTKIKIRCCIWWRKQLIGRSPISGEENEAPHFSRAASCACRAATQALVRPRTVPGVYASRARATSHTRLPSSAS